MSFDEYSDNGTGAGEPRGSAEIGVSAAPGLLRLAATAWWHTAEWAMETTLRTGAEIARATLPVDPDPDAIRDAAGTVLRYAGRALGFESETADDLGAERPGDRNGSEQSLREQGAELLRRSADVRVTEEVHPAYERILGDLAPDEGRILRLLAQQGPQPSIDVRGGLPVVDSELVAPGLNMIGAEAGCRHLDRVQAYLNNLNRLGLIWFSREPVKDRLRYQVLEAQPNVAEAMKDAGRFSRTVRRSIHLTPFGEDFCDVVLPVGTEELEALPGAGPGDVEAISEEAPVLPGGAA